MSFINLNILEMVDAIYNYFHFLLRNNFNKKFETLNIPSLSRIVFYAFFCSSNSSTHSYLSRFHIDDETRAAHTHTYTYIENTAPVRHQNILNGHYVIFRRKKNVSIGTRSTFDCVCMCLRAQTSYKWTTCMSMRHVLCAVTTYIFIIIIVIIIIIIIADRLQRRQ